MKKSVEKIEVASIVDVLQGLTPRQTLDRKKYKAYYDGLTDVLLIVYKVYQAREQGKSTDEAESEAKTKVTEFLHTLGKVNGKYISVCEPMTEKNGQTSILFDTLIYHSFRDRIYTKSNTLASLECEKKTAGQNKAKAHKDLIEGKGSAKAYKEAVKVYDDIMSKIEAERAKAGTEGELTEKQSPSTFIKFATSRLKAIINKRLAMTKEEAEALRKLRNKATKEARNGKAKAEPKPKAKPEAVKPEAEKVTA